MSFPSYLPSPPSEWGRGEEVAWAAGHFFPTRVTLIGGTSGCSTSSTVRLIDCQVNELSSRRVRRFVAVMVPPSPCTPPASIFHLLPSRLQVACPNAPWLSNVHECSVPVLGSLPII